MNKGISQTECIAIYTRVDKEYTTQILNLAHFVLFD